MKERANESRCDHPCTDVIELLTDHEVPANVGIRVPPLTPVDGFRHVHLYVEFTQKDPEEEPVDLAVFDPLAPLSQAAYSRTEQKGAITTRVLP